MVSHQLSLPGTTSVPFSSNVKHNNNSQIVLFRLTENTTFFCALFCVTYIY